MVPVKKKGQGTRQQQFILVLIHKISALSALKYALHWLHCDKNVINVDPLAFLSGFRRIVYVNELRLGTFCGLQTRHFCLHFSPSPVTRVST